MSDVFEIKSRANMMEKTHMHRHTQSILYKLCLCVEQLHKKIKEFAHFVIFNYSLMNLMNNYNFFF